MKTHKLIKVLLATLTVACATFPFVELPLPADAASNTAPVEEKIPAQNAPAKKKPVAKAPAKSKAPAKTKATTQSKVPTKKKVATKSKAPVRKTTNKKTTKKRAPARPARKKVGIDVLIRQRMAAKGRPCSNTPPKPEPKPKPIPRPRENYPVTGIIDLTIGAVPDRTTQARQGWNWDMKRRILTLENLRLRSWGLMFRLPANSQLRLIGENHIQMSGSGAAIRSLGHLVVQGPGSLTVTSPKPENVVPVQSDGGIGFMPPRPVLETRKR